MIGLDSRGRYSVFFVTTLGMLTAFEAPCVAAPLVSAGRIITGSINVLAPDAAPKVALNILGSAAEVDFAWVGPSGEPFYQIFIGGTYQRLTIFRGRALDEDVNGKHTSLCGVGPLSLGGPPNQEAAWGQYAESGTWTLASLTVCTSPHDQHTYTASSLKSLFPGLTFTVINPHPADVTPPVASAGSIDTPTVSISKSPSVHITLTGSDAGSGIGEASVCAQTSQSGVISGQICADSILPAPRASGPIDLFTSIGGGSFNPPGTYTICCVTLRDVAGNETSIYDAATIQALFKSGDTFQVMQ